MQGETCKTCKFCYIGECRRYPPAGETKFHELTGVSHDVYWPRVADYNWCGEYKSKLDEIREKDSTQA